MGQSSEQSMHTKQYGMYLNHILMTLWSHFTEKEVIIRNVQWAMYRWTLAGV